MRVLWMMQCYLASQFLSNRNGRLFEIYARHARLVVCLHSYLFKKVALWESSEWSESRKGTALNNIQPKNSAYSSSIFPHLETYEPIKSDVSEIACSKIMYLHGIFTEIFKRDHRARNIADPCLQNAQIHARYARYTCLYFATPFILQNFLTFRILSWKTWHLLLCIIILISRKQSDSNPRWYGSVRNSVIPYVPPTLSAKPFNQPPPQFQTGATARTWRLPKITLRSELPLSWFDMRSIHHWVPTFPMCEIHSQQFRYRSTKREQGATWKPKREQNSGFSFDLGNHFEHL